MLHISATDAWAQAHPGAIIGLLEIRGVDNTRPSAALQARQRAAEARLREMYRGYTRADWLALPVMAAYHRYYRRFNKTYHVLLQVESLVLKGKDLPAVSPLVDATFTAELETLVLTAGHDVARLQGDVWMDVSREGDVMTQMNGTSRPIYAGDMVMRDAAGLCCCIIYGQDDRSPITAATSHVLYVSYAPAGVPAAAVEAHQRAVVENVLTFAPAAVLVQQRLIIAPG